ncbi:FAD-binding oxidoreductase [Streptomyces sp. NBC_00083]|uniref:NAD(P)/FAD-dependent oxidoreductase n=1 Tax=Streptomyces sp. NBC_00083 TaxID=2975647 RepID=UPI002250D8B0|nr:FAD-dependent oxidoreductase [Streptomyces sp. NBC_00083]MCX5386206.1 FAD-binding oxidoreductase [Streptomyces sp. NBC_00083]
MTHVDVAVVGGGVIGCMIAREVALRAAHASVLVLDKDAVGSGASRRSAGLHFPRGTSERVRRMSAYSQASYRALLDADPALPIHPVPLLVVSDRASADQVEAAYLDEAGLSRVDALPDWLPPLSPETAAWTGEGAQYADVGALARVLARSLRPGTTFREGVRVDSLERVGSGYELGLGTGERVTAGSVVLAPGPWLAAPAWRERLAVLDARVKKVVALHIEEPPAARDGVVVFHDEDAFLLPLHGQRRWLFSYTSQVWDVDPDRLTGSLSPSDLAEARDVLLRRAPRLADSARSGRVFCDAYSADREPVVRALDEEGRLVFAGCANGSGYRLAPAIAREAAQLLRTAVENLSDQGSHR